MRICPKCHAETDQFNKNQRVCRSCQSAYYKANKVKHIENVRQGKIRRRGERYGLTPEQHDTLRASNSGMCHICNVRIGVHIDHDHTTGKVRGHLCSQCNTALGLFLDDKNILAKAINYLG